MALTDREIRFAKTPEGLNQAELREDQVRGLVPRVYKSGVKVWFVFYRRKEDDRRRYLKLGTCSGLGLKQARDLPEIELGRIAAGEDPQAERQANREGSEAPTVAALAELNLESYSKPYKRPAGYQMDRWQLDRYREGEGHRLTGRYSRGGRRPVEPLRRPRGDTRRSVSTESPSIPRSWAGGRASAGCGSPSR